MKNKELAEAIVEALRDATAPGACSWGDEFPDAHAKLFGGTEGKSKHGGYFPDMVGTVRRLLRKRS